MFDWNEERIADLRRLNAMGLSGSQIASSIGGLTRNAVIGKMSRLGIRSCNRYDPCVPQATIRVRPARRPRWRHAKGRPAEAAADELPAGETVSLPPETQSLPPVPLPDLKAHHCRWPISDAADSLLGFCGAEPAEGLPYCAAHCRMAYRMPVKATRAESEVRRRAARKAWVHEHAASHVPHVIGGNAAEEHETEELGDGRRNRPLAACEAHGLPLRNAEHDG